MSVHQAFESQSESKTKNSERIKLSFYSSTGKKELEEYIDLYHKPGYGSVSGGFVENVTYRQVGPVWYADVSIWRELSELTVRLIRSPLQHSLRTICLSLPLNKKNGYRTKWDHFLWKRIPVQDATSGTGVSGSTSGSSSSLPNAYATATSDAPFEDNGTYYRWTLNGTDLDGVPKNGYLWTCVATPTKPGVESFDYHTYQIIETGEYPTEKYAAWVTDILADRVRDKPLLGDFGLSARLPGRNWKCDDASVEYNGKRWTASMTWTMSGDDAGWDPDLYDAAGNIGGSGSTLPVSGSTSGSSGTLGSGMNWQEIN